jgi:hypothetical protein
MVLRAGWLLPFFVSVGCGQTVTAHAVEGRAGAYEIECVEEARCVAKAREVCGERYQVLSKWEHPIILPEARPGAREYPRHFAQQVSDWEAYSSNTGPSDAATAPPLRGLDVVCVN